MTDDMISKVDACAIIYSIDPETLARRVWRAASEEYGRERAAAAVLDLSSGALRILTWRAGGMEFIPRKWIVLAWITSMAHERAGILSHDGGLAARTRHDLP